MNSGESGDPVHLSRARCSEDRTAEQEQGVILLLKSGHTCTQQCRSRVQILLANQREVL